jgi:ketosteroid isomerase-like protein
MSDFLSETDETAEPDETPSITRRIHLVRAYFDACTNGRPEDIAACFTDDAVIYDTNHAPVRGHAAIGAFWTGVRDRWAGAAWIVDSGIEEGDVAAVEWTMSGYSETGPFAFRGSEHYRFEEHLIAEIRQYWTFDVEAPGSELLGFPYDR